MRRLQLSLFLLLMLLLTPACLQGQNVQQGALNELGLARRKLYNAARKQGRIDWTQSYDNLRGTQVQLSFSARAADVTIYTPIDFGQTKLLTVCRAIADQLHMPKADYITYASTKRTIVDIELNKYIEKRPRQSDFYLDLPALAGALRRSDLPAPILISIETEDATQTTIESRDSVRSLDKTLFLSLDEVMPGARLHYRASVTWQTCALVVFFGGLFLIIPSAILLSTFGLRKGTAQPKLQPEITPPDEVQRRYDKSAPRWILMFFPMLIPVLFVGFSALGGIQKGMSGMELLIPFRLTTAAFVMLGFTVLFVALRILFMQRKRPVLQGGEQPEPAITNHFARLMIIPMFMMLLMPIIIFFPIYSPSGLLLRRNLVWAAIALCFIGMAVGGYRTWQKSRTLLSSGEWCDLVQGMAHLAGLQVRRVDLVPSPTLNAYATLFGSVGLTTALIQKLDRAEVKAIVAHELGHIKLRHLWKQFVISVICTGTLWLIWYMLRSALMPHASDEMRSIFSSMLFFLLFSGIPVAAITGFGRRKREHEADMLAVHWTGDPELVIRALTKVHTLNASPHLLKPGDELISGHPSLVNRIKAIRAQTAS